MTAPTHKLCPQCQTPAPLHLAACAHCGRPYRTRFAADGSPLPAPDPAPAPYLPSPYVPPAQGYAAPVPGIRPRQLHRWRIPGAIALLAVVACLGVVMFSRAQWRPPAVSSDAPTHKLWYYQSNTVPMGQTVADLEEYQLAGPHIGSEGDGERLLEMRTSGRIYMTEKETEVVLLGASGNYVSVRLCSGRHAGQSGWTRKEGLHPFAEPVAPPPVPAPYRSIAPHGVG